MQGPSPLLAFKPPYLFFLLASDFHTPCLLNQPNIKRSMILFFSSSVSQFSYLLVGFVFFFFLEGLLVIVVHITGGFRRKGENQKSILYYPHRLVELCVFSFPVFLSAHTGLLKLVMGEAGSTDFLPVLRNSEGVTTHLNIVLDQTPNQSALLPGITKHIKGDNKGQLSVLSGWRLFFLCNMDIQWFTTVMV